MISGELRALITLKRSVFSLSRENALYRVIAASTPRVKSETVDYKKTISDELFTASGLLVETVIQNFLGETSSFFSQVQPLSGIYSLIHSVPPTSMLLTRSLVLLEIC